MDSCKICNEVIDQPNTSIITTIKSGQVDMTLKGDAARSLATAFADQFRECGGINYVELKYACDNDLDLVVTMQKIGGKTPGDVIEELRGENKRLQEKIDNFELLNGAQMAQCNTDKLLSERDKANIAYATRIMSNGLK